MVQMRPLFQLVFFDGSCCRRRFSERTHIHLACVGKILYPDPAWFARNNYEMELPIFQCMLDRTSHDWRGCRFPRNSSDGKKAGKPLANGWRACCQLLSCLLRWAPFLIPFGSNLESKRAPQKDSPFGHSFSRRELKEAGSKSGRACLVQLAGGLDYCSKRFDAPRRSNRNKPCSICKATYRGHLSWRDNRLNSGWQNASLSPRTFRSHVSPKCPLFQLPGMSSLSMAMDPMHCHHLGWLQYLFRSIIHLLVFYVLPNAHLDNLAQIGHFTKDFQERRTTANTHTE